MVTVQNVALLDGVKSRPVKNSDVLWGNTAIVFHAQ